MELAFDEIRAANAVGLLKPHQQLAFGAACCERILPNYRVFSEEVKWGDSEPLRKALDFAWLACQDLAPEPKTVQALLAACENNAPDSEDFDSLYTSSAQDAVFAICSLLDFLLTGNSSHVVNAARYATDSIDLIVQERDDLSPQDPGLEQKILQHPLMQQELRRQSRDLVDQPSRNDAGAQLIFKVRAQGERAFALPEELKCQG